MNEFMGNIYGVYDAKEKGFIPGGGSMHQTFIGHGPEKEVFEKGSNVILKPVKQENTMSFMFETCVGLKYVDSELLRKYEEHDYRDCWKGLDKISKL